MGSEQSLVEPDVFQAFQSNAAQRQRVVPRTTQRDIIRAQVMQSLKSSRDEWDDWDDEEWEPGDRQVWEDNHGGRYEFGPGSQTVSDVTTNGSVTFTNSAGGSSITIRDGNSVQKIGNVRARGGVTITNNNTTWRRVY